MVEVTAHEHGWGPTPSATSMDVVSFLPLPSEDTLVLTTHVPMAARRAAWTSIRFFAINDGILTHQSIGIPHGQKESHTDSPCRHFFIPLYILFEASSPVPTIKVASPTSTTPRLHIRPSSTEETTLAYSHTPSAVCASA
jgi:hypothetical protein